VSAPEQRRRGGGMRWVRTWLPVGIILSGLILMALVRDINGVEGGALLISAGLSVWLLNWFYRVGVKGDRDRETEDEARAYFDRHGHWPDEAPADAPEPPSDPGHDAGHVPPRDPHRHPPGNRRERPGSRPRRPGP
jgi:hypothetical protein